MRTCRIALSYDKVDRKQLSLSTEIIDIPNHSVQLRSTTPVKEQNTRATPGSAMAHQMIDIKGCVGPQYDKT